MKDGDIAIAVSLAVALPLVACSPSAARLQPREPALRSASQTAEAREIDALLSRYADYGFAGSVLVRRGNETLLSKGYGFADAEARVPNGPATLYDVASIAKTFTAAAILDLEARGRLSVGDPISRYFPGLPADKHGITIHQLLTHTAGFPLDAEHVGATAADTIQELVTKIGGAPLLHAPGSAYHYSNVGYGVLALIVERASGQSWQSYVRRRLLDRAGLRRTFLYGERVPAHLTLATGYMGPTDEQAEAQPPLAPPGNNHLLWGKYMLGSVGTFAPVEDLSRWWRALNGDRLLPAAQRAKLFAVQAANQGYGWNIAQDGSAVTRISRGGLRGSYNSLISYYPERDTLIVFAMNRNIPTIGPGLVWNNLARIMSGEQVPFPPPIVRLNANALERHAGRYRLSSGGTLWFRPAAGILYFGAEGQDALTPLADPAGTHAAHLPRLHAATQRLAAALAAGGATDPLARAGLTQPQIAALSADWARWMGETGGFGSAELLGSTPGAANYTRTFLRLRGPRGEKVVRFLWDPATDRLLAWGDDIPLPAYVRLWPQSENRFVSYDFQSDRLTTFSFTGDGNVTISSQSGEAILTAAR